MCCYIIHMWSIHTFWILYQYNKNHPTCSPNKICAIPSWSKGHCFATWACRWCATIAISEHSISRSSHSRNVGTLCQAQSGMQNAARRFLRMAGAREKQGSVWMESCQYCFWQMCIGIDAVNHTDHDIYLTGYFSKIPYVLGTWCFRTHLIDKFPFPYPVPRMYCSPTFSTTDMPQTHCLS